LEVLIERGVIKALKKYPDTHRKKIFDHIRRLEDPYTAPDVECLFPAEQMYRMHIGRSYTILFRILKEKDTVLVLDLMTIEQAHKRYGRYH
jgi:mRNA-degrading endonuclease RelE of RelBE toxin-antitoxin system